MVFIAILLALSALAYVVTILMFSIGWQRVFKQSSHANHSCCKSSVTVVVPFRNEERNLSGLVACLRNQELDSSQFDVILVNDGSTDSSLEIATTLVHGDSYFRVISLPFGLAGKKSALQHALQFATGDYVMLFDADSTVPPSWLRDMLCFANSQGLMLLQGPVDVLGVRLGLLQTLEYAALSASTAGGFGVGMPIMASSANLLVRQSVFATPRDVFKSHIPSGDDMFLLHYVKGLPGAKTGYLLSAGAMASTLASSSPFVQRLRWAGKAPAYTDRQTIAIGATVLMINLLLVVGAIFTSFYCKALFPLFVLVWSVKVAVDILLVYPHLKFLNRRGLVWLFIPLQVIYPIYVVVTVFVSLLIPVYKWKSRRIMTSS